MTLRLLGVLGAAGLLAAASTSHAQTFLSLHSYWNPADLDNLCSSNPFLYSTPSPTYGWFRTEGQVFSPAAALPAGLLDMQRLQRWYSPLRGDYFTTTHSAWQGSAGQSRAPDYSWVAHEGWIFPTPVAGTSELRLYFSAARGDNFITSNTRYNTYLNVPGYSQAGLQGYIINGALGQTDLVSNFNFGTLYAGGPADGSKRLCVLLTQYSDEPMRHTSSQINQFIYGLSFPSVNNYFYAISMNRWLWLNAGVRGPYTIPNEADTTGDESKWRDTWDSTYAPFLYLSLQTSNNTHWWTTPGGAGSTVNANAGFADAYEVFTLADINGGNLLTGETIAFKTYMKTWIRVSGTSLLGDAANNAGSDTRFTITKVSGSAGTQIMTGDVVRLQSVATAEYLRAPGNGGSALLADATVPGADSNFTMFKNGLPVAWQVRESLKQLYAAGGNLNSLDLNGDGTVTNAECQFFVIGSGPADPPGPGTTNDGASARWGGIHQPAGSTKIFDPGSVAGAGEDVSLMTFCHELVHALGANYELYGAFGAQNYQMSLMGATIFGIDDDRRTFNLDPWTRMRLGWLRPRIFSLSDAGGSAVLEVADDGFDNTTKKPILLVDPLRFNFDTGEGEFFLLEYRNPNVTGDSYDTNAASQGLAIWQCKTGPGGTNIVIPSVWGACCTGAACSVIPQYSCTGAGQVYKGLGTACSGAAGNVCPVGTPVQGSIDGSINLLGAPNYGRGVTTAWTTSNQPASGIVPKYVDGTSAPAVIRAGSMTTTGRTMEVEWSYSGDLPPRIDMVDRTMLRRGSTLTLTGMFGVRTPLIDLRTGPTLSGSMSVISRTITEVEARTPRASPPVGFYRLNARSSTFLGNQVQIRITYAADWNESGTTTVADIFAFLTDWFAGVGDYTENGATTVNDIFGFLADWFAGL